MQMQRDVPAIVLHIDEHVASTVKTVDRRRSHPLTHNHNMLYYDGTYLSVHYLSNAHNKSVYKSGQDEIA